MSQWKQHVEQEEKKVSFHPTPWTPVMLPKSWKDKIVITMCFKFWFENTAFSVLKGQSKQQLSVCDSTTGMNVDK